MKNLIIAVCAALVLLLAGCGNQGGGENTSTKAAGETTAAQTTVTRAERTTAPSEETTAPPEETLTPPVSEDATKSAGEPTTRSAQAPAGQVQSPNEAMDIVNDKIKGDYEPREDTIDDTPGGYTQYQSKDNESLRLLCWGEAELYNDGNYYYVVQQYENVIDDPKTGDSHTATSNWFYVNADTGETIPWWLYGDDGTFIGENERWTALLPA